MRRFYLFFVISFLSCRFFQKEVQTKLKVFVSGSSCKQDLYYGPGKKFAIYVFCDDAVGTTVGIINTQPGAYVGPGSENAWELHDRFLQDKDWALDVDFFEWSSNGLKVIIKTNAIYGTGKTYKIDLLSKKFEERF